MAFEPGDSARCIRSQLDQKAGLSETKVEYKIIPDERAGRGTVIYEIAEAPKIKLEDVYFDGASAFTQKKLRS